MSCRVTTRPAKGAPFIRLIGMLDKVVLGVLEKEAAMPMLNELVVPKFEITSSNIRLFVLRAATGRKPRRLVVLTVLAVLLTGVLVSSGSAGWEKVRHLPNQAHPMCVTYDRNGMGYDPASRQAYSPS